MRSNKVKALWRDDRPAAAGWMFMADTYAAEIMANVGFDALVLDMQHGMAIGPDRAGLWLQAVSTTATTPFVRVPWNEPYFIQWVLDAGAYGVIVPLVNNAAEAAKAGRACRYPPLGYRSIGANRGMYYAGQDYLSHANDEIACLVMIEDIDTISRLDEIAQAPGIDGFYIGPRDLALSLGIADAKYAGHQRHEDACQNVLDAARRHGLVAGVHCGSPEEAAQRFAQGFRLCPVAVDTRLLESGGASALKAAKSRSVGAPSNKGAGY